MNILFSHYAIIDKQGFGRSFMLARELVSLGNQVTFLTTQPSGQFSFPYREENRDGVRLIVFSEIVPDFMRRTGFGFLSVLLKTIYLFFNNYDIYHADVGHRPSGGLPIIIKKCFIKIVYVSEWWDHFGKGGQFDNKKGIKKITHGYYDLLFEVCEKKIADGIICLSSGMFERAISLGLGAEKLIIITGGADTKAIKFFTSSSKKEKHGIPKNSISFCFVGMNDGELNDILPFIKAINKLKNKNIEVTWFTTGNRISSTLKKKHEIGSELIEFGWVDYNKYSEILSCADAFILLQRENIKSYTRWPNKMGDYLAAARPILINPYGETETLVNTQKDFFLITKYDTDHIYETISNFVQKRNSQINISIRSFAENEYSWQHKARQLIEFYNYILNEKQN